MKNEGRKGGKLNKLFDLMQFVDVSLSLKDHQSKQKSKDVIRDVTISAENLPLFGFEGENHGRIQA